MQRTAMRMTEFIRASRSGQVGSRGGIVASQPWWVVRTTILTFVLVAAIPLLVAMVAATLAAVVVFSVLALINAVMQRVGLGGRSSTRAGRENVRVIPPEGDGS